MSFVSARDFLVSDDKFPTCCTDQEHGDGIATGTPKS
jgi:hypothetical protein